MSRKSETTPMTTKEKIEIRLMPAAQMIATQASGMDVDQACAMLRSLVEKAKGAPNARQ